MRERVTESEAVADDLADIAELFDTYAADLYTRCLSLLADRADSAERAAAVVQDTFVIAAARLSRLRDRSQRRSWLFAVAQNECRPRRSRLAWLDEADGAGGAAGQAAGTRPGSALRPALSSDERESAGRLPASLRGQVLRLISNDSVAAQQYRELIAGQAGRFTRSGFPARASRAKVRGGLRRQAAAAAAGAGALAVLAGGGTAVALTRLGQHAPPQRPSSAAASTPHAFPAARPPSDAAPAPLATAPASIPRRRTPGARPTSSTRPPAASTRPPAASSTPAAPAAPGLDVTSAQPITLAGNGNGVYTGSFTLLAVGSAENYTVSEPAGEQQVWIGGASPASGTLQAGQSVAITVLFASGLDFTSAQTVTLDVGPIVVRFVAPA